MAPLLRFGRRIPWVRVMMAARWLYERGKSNLSEAERRELGQILRKSKGDPRKLVASERQRIRGLVTKGLRGK